MNKFIWQDHIVIDSDLHHGDPCIRGTRIPVSIIVGSLADGMTPAEIQSAYPQLSLADIQAALAYAAQVIQQDIFAPFPVAGVAYAH
jgi:uncharacterized protein (DUF433 family)